MERFRSVEVLLRVLAFGDRRETYDGNLAKFLNSYMHERMDDATAASSLGQELELVAAKAKAILASTNGTKLPLMIIEALLVALYSHRHTLAERTAGELATAYEAMLALPTFSDGARYAVSSEANVKERLDAAVATFAQV